MKFEASQTKRVLIARDVTRRGADLSARAEMLPYFKAARIRSHVRAISDMRIELNSVMPGLVRNPNSSVQVDELIHAVGKMLEGVSVTCNAKVTQAMRTSDRQRDVGWYEPTSERKLIAIRFQALMVTTARVRSTNSSSLNRRRA
jgi:hypothetical protein